MPPLFGTIPSHKRSHAKGQVLALAVLLALFAAGTRALSAPTNRRRAHAQTTYLAKARRARHHRGPQTHSRYARFSRKLSRYIEARQLSLALFGLIYVVLVLDHRRKHLSELDAERSQPPRRHGAFKPRAVFLGRQATPDAANLEIVLNSPKPPAPTTDMAATVAPATRAAAPLTMALAAPAVPAAEVHQRRPEPASPLPSALVGHFDAVADEQLVWHAPFRVPLGGPSGHLAVTNVRVLAVYRRTVLSGLLPPKLETLLCRHQYALTAVTRTETTSTRRGLLLMLALVFLWYPLGTFAAVLLLAAYLLIPRPALTVATTDTPRHLYPLSPGDIVEARRALATATSAAKERQAASGLGGNQKVG